MKRGGSIQRGIPGSGQRVAAALGAIATEDYVRSVIALHDALLGGAQGWIKSRVAKLDSLTGEELADYTEPGDYVTIGYEFALSGPAGDSSWEVPREIAFEGDVPAADYAAALGARSDRDFCELMVHVKGIHDRLRGEVFIRPYEQDEIVVGYLWHYNHLIRGDGEPDARLAGPPPAEAETGPQPEAAGAPEEAGEDAADSQPAEPVEA